MTTQTTFSTLGELLALFGPAQLGPRTRGSTTRKGLDALPPDRVADEFEPAPGCRFGAARYFRVWAPELDGRLGAVRLGDLPEEGRKILKRRAAPHGHGDEYYLDRPEREAVMAPAQHVTVIIGPDSEPPAGKGAAHLVGYTWHPGDPLAPCPPLGTDATPDVGVKVHNG